MAVMLDGFRGEFEAFAARGVEPDQIWLWPYDQGGCACEACAPWGANGFLVASEAVARMARERFPGVKVILSTWLFDFQRDEGEWEGLARAFAEPPDWLDYVLADSHGADFPRYPLERGVPGGMPLLNFPEISMYGMFPWGGFGANPLPKRFQRLWDEAGDRLAGGFPYSEGIFEDINKAVESQFYWSDREAADTVREYAAYEFSPDVADDVAAAIGILEANHGTFPGVHPGRTDGPYEPPREAVIDAGARRAFDLLDRAQSRLTPRARSSWRWRILYLRAMIDREHFTNGGLPTGRCQDAFAELAAIYHADNAELAVLPPSRAALAKWQP
jgi:hypothetical protein